jgi:hypothetical protein
VSKLREEQGQKADLTDEDNKNFELELPELIVQAIHDEKEIDWEYAQREKMEKADKVRKVYQDIEDQAKLEEKQKYEKEQEMMKLKQQEFEDKMKELGKFINLIIYLII